MMKCAHKIEVQVFTKSFKLCLLLLGFASLVVLTACAFNPATGRTQFTGLMSPAEEMRVGAQEHPRIIAAFGEYNEQGVQDYVRRVGARVTEFTERPDVEYRFYVLDSPIVNAFALPGGYIYVSRGLLALANSEAELAAVLAHEAGHITGRHSAERYSRSVVTSLGANILSAVVDQTGVSQALGLGADLYLKSYSRAQESEADTLGIRYLARAGYDPQAMTAFLQNLRNSASLQALMNGEREVTGIAGYFSTHPSTQERLEKTTRQVMAQELAAGNEVGRERYLREIDGMVYGESATHGFVRGNSFYHPVLGFGFSVPEGFEIFNRPSEVVAQGPGGAVLVYDMVPRQGNLDAMAYLRQVWMEGEDLSAPEYIEINGMPAATASLSGRVNGVSSSIRLIAIAYGPERFARFLLGIPGNASPQMIEDLKRATYSFHKLSAQEKADIRPYRLEVFKAGPGDTAGELAARQPFDEFSEERFRVLNALSPNQGLQAGRLYKLIVR